ncbi:MAG: bacteriohemerythrin [Deferribacteraceae bacterium]|jgi:hemerythrin-like metal-binding protein|nr:bacteriohemerythrin [Deferribacteraceae bacterium]
MSLVQWTDSLSVKIEKFDGEHKKLLDIINVLYESTSQGKGTDVISKTLKDLISYTQTHFKHEEDFLKGRGYNGIATQQEQHKVFVDKIAEFQKKYDAGSMTSTISMFTFLSSWLINHIQKVDSLYAKEYGGQVA